MPRIDTLDTPELERRTRRVLALREEEKQNEAERAYIMADIGDELIATKADLDKNTWLGWLSKNLNFTVQSADNYMKVARLRARFKNVFKSFARLGPAALYLIAALPDALIDRLAADPRLPSPETGQLTPLEDMSDRDLKKALEIFRGKAGPPAKIPAPAGTRNALAQAAMRAVRATLTLISAVNGGTAKLDAQLKRDMLDLIEMLRGAVLHWKAWVTPEKGRRLD